MAFSREVQHGTGTVLSQQGIHQRAVAQVALHEEVARVALQAGEVLQVAGVSEFVEVDDRFVAGAEPVEHKIAADEAGNQDTHNFFKNAAINRPKLPIRV